MKLLRQITLAAGIAAACLMALPATPVFAQAPKAPASGYNVIYVFPPGTNTQASQPSAQTIAQGRNGVLYSTTANGGGFYGSVFSITTSGVSAIVNGIGYFPAGGVTLGTDGNFYTTNSDGGPGGNCGFSGCGQVIKVTPAGAATVIYNFTGFNDGASPQSSPIEVPGGEFYGTTQIGGSTGFGTVYKVSPSGAFATIHTFSGPDGQYPIAPLVLGTDGNFYGTCSQGGTNGDGVIFKMTAAGVVTVLHSFTGAPDGASPNYALIQASDGNFYGNTSGGGAFYGTIFKVNSSGAYSVIHTFNDNPDGADPASSLIQATDGNLYGVANAGGTLNFGTIYSITTGGTYNVVYTFDNTTGASPASPLIQHTDGILYSNTFAGGDLGNCDTYGCGVFYSVNLGLKPFVTFVMSSGKEGSTAQILGQGFTKATTVSFNGIPGTIIAGTTTILGVTVPPGATTGTVTVTTGSKTLTSNVPFRVTPAILSFSPPSGPVGTVVTITGTGLLQTSKVAFDKKLATNFTVNSDTQITATVPTGAKTGKIAVETPGGIGESTTNFTVN